MGPLTREVETKKHDMLQQELYIMVYLARHIYSALLVNILAYVLLHRWRRKFRPSWYNVATPTHIA